jgi:hypothetical protein
MEKIGNLNLISALLGFLGAANSLAIDFYLISTILGMSRIVTQSLDGWVASMAIVTIMIALIYGSFLILRGKNRKGGKINTAGGLILACIYIYYSAFSEPKFLNWLNPIGIILVIPPILSGIIGLLHSVKTLE